jgi:2-iminobutanoate/2-iminopropanoate deaminase
MKKTIVLAEEGVAAPYSPATVFRSFVFVSGQGPRNRHTKKLGKQFQDQMVQTMENLKWILQCNGSSMENVLKITMYLKDLNQYQAANRIYKRYFSGSLPARTCVEVARLPNDIQVEIEAIAFRKTSRQ